MVLLGFYVFLCAAGVAALAGVCHQLYFSGRIVQWRLLRTARSVPIQDFEDGGIGKIVGRVEYVDTPLTAPLSGRRCAFYEATVEQGTEDRWVLMARDARGCRFRLRDATGVAIVEPGQVEVFIVKDRLTHSGPGDPADPVEHAFLDGNIHKSRRRLLNKTKILRYHEGVLEEGEEVAVLGFGRREPDLGAVSEARGYRDGAPMRLFMTGSPRKPLLISDEPTAMGRRSLPPASSSPDGEDETSV